MNERLLGTTLAVWIVLSCVAILAVLQPQPVAIPQQQHLQTVLA